MSTLYAFVPFMDPRHKWLTIMGNNLSRRMESTESYFQPLFQFLSPYVQSHKITYNSYT